jgi:predicted transcriptional regulator
VGNRLGPLTWLAYSLRRMSDQAPLQGELQIQIMAAIWRIGSGTVEDVRTALPARYRSAYNTVQTVLNRLSERGLLRRDRRGAAYIYTPLVSEAEYLTRSIRQSLAVASSDARETALAQLIGAMDESQLAALRKRAKDVARRRGKS